MSLIVSEAGGDTPVQPGDTVTAELLTTATHTAGSWVSSGGAGKDSSLQGKAGRTRWGAQHR